MRGASALKAGTTLVLCYHRVAEGVADPFRLCVAPQRFRAQLEELCRSGEPSTLDDVGSPAKRGRFVVTFDDGYADNLWNALPAASSLGVPITIFVTTDAIGGAGFWWDRLASLVNRIPQPTSPRTVHLAVDGGVEVAFGKGPVAALEAIHRRLLPLTAREIDRVLLDLAARWDLPPDGPDDARPLTTEELGTLVGEDCARIGAHTTDHVRLAGLSAPAQLERIAGARQDLASLAGTDVVHFAYPFGGRDDFDDCSVEQARLAGFRTACTTLPGAATPSTDPFRLPRRLVMDWPRPRFGLQLLRWRLW